MSTAITYRPSLGPLKTAFRKYRRQRLCERCLATRAQTRIASPPNERFVVPPRQQTKSPYRILNDTVHEMPPMRAVPSPPSAARKYPFPLQDWQDMHLPTLDPTSSRTRLFSKDNPDNPKPGDILLATFKSGEPFSGVCLSIRRRGLDTSILLRNRLMTTGVEMWVKIYSPTVKSIEVVKRAQKRARRARLYHMRKVKHDRGSVEGVVEQYLKRRRLIRSGGMAVKDPKLSAKQPGQAKTGAGAR